MDRKIVLGVVVVVVLLLVVWGGGAKTTGYSVSEQEVGNLYEASLGIDDMYCMSCAYGVEAQMEELDGVIDASVDYKTASGVVLYDRDKVSAEEIALASTVYPAHVVSDVKK